MTLARFGWILAVVVAFAVGAVFGAVMTAPPGKVSSSESKEGATFYGRVSGKRLIAPVLQEELAKTANWTGTEALPISPLYAATSARKALNGEVGNVVRAWNLESIELKRVSAKYLYVVRFAPVQWMWREDSLDYYQVLVYLTGK